MIASGHSKCICKSEISSLPEKILAFYLSKIDCTIKIQERIGGYKFDFYLPKFNLVIEYDGFPWHNTEQAMTNDETKDRICLNQKLNLIRLRDDRLNKYNNPSATIYSFKYDEKHEYLTDFFNNDLKINKSIIDIDINRDNSEIFRFNSPYDEQNSLYAICPIIYDYLDKQYINMDPAKVTHGSNKIYYHLKHPCLDELVWFETAQNISSRYMNFRSVIPEKIKMCFSLYQRYPELKDQVLKHITNISRKTIFTIQCKKCKNNFSLNYNQLIEKGKRELCNDCVKASRFDNLQRWREKSK